MNWNELWFLFCLAVLLASLVTLLLFLLEFVSDYLWSHNVFRRIREWYTKKFWGGER